MQNNNPLSPHLQIYKWHLSSLLSITHRVVGVINFFALMVICFWAISLFFGENFYRSFEIVLNTFFGKFFTASFTKPSFIIADVPIITLLIPKEIHFSISLIVLIPPPNWTLQLVFSKTFLIEFSFLNNDLHRLVYLKNRRLLI